MLTLQLHIPGSVTLKDKRQVLRSVNEQTMLRYDVSVADVSNQNYHQLVTVSVAGFGSDNRVVQGILVVERSLEIW